MVLVDDLPPSLKDKKRVIDSDESDLPPSLRGKNTSLNDDDSDLPPSLRKNNDDNLLDTAIDIAKSAGKNIVDRVKNIPQGFEAARKVQSARDNDQRLRTPMNEAIGRGYDIPVVGDIMRSGMPKEVAAGAVTSFTGGLIDPTQKQESIGKGTVGRTAGEVAGGLAQLSMLPTVKGAGLVGKTAQFAIPLAESRAINKINSGDTDVPEYVKEVVTQDIPVGLAFGAASTASKAFTGSLDTQKATAKALQFIEEKTGKTITPDLAKKVFDGLTRSVQAVTAGGVSLATGQSKEQALTNALFAALQAPEPRAMMPRAKELSPKVEAETPRPIIEPDDLPPYGPPSERLPATLPGSKKILPSIDYKAKAADTIELKPNDRIDGVTVQDAGKRIIDGDKTVIKNIMEGVNNLGVATIQDQVINKGVERAFAGRIAKSIGPDGKASQAAIIKAEEGIKAVMPEIEKIFNAGPTKPRIVPRDGQLHVQGDQGQHLGKFGTVNEAIKAVEQSQEMVLKNGVLAPKEKRPTPQENIAQSKQRIATVLNGLSPRAKELIDEAIKTIEFDLIGTKGTARNSNQAVRPNDLKYKPLIPGKKQALKYEIAKTRLANGYVDQLAGPVPPDLEFLSEINPEKSRQLFSDQATLKAIGFPTEEEYNFDKGLVALADQGELANDLPEVIEAREATKKYETVRERLYPAEGQENARGPQAPQAGLPQKAAPTTQVVNSPVSGHFVKKPLRPDKVAEHNLFEKAYEMSIQRHYNRYKTGVDQVKKDIEKAAELEKQIAKFPKALQRTDEQRQVVRQYNFLNNKQNKDYYNFWTSPSSQIPNVSRLEALKIPSENKKNSYRGIYIKEVKKLISSGYDVPQEMINQFPEFKTAMNSRARYEKGYNTSFANKSTAVDYSTKNDYGFKVKNQDGTPISERYIKQITQAAHEFEKMSGPIKDIINSLDLTIAHTKGKFPFLRSDASGLYSPGEKTITVGMEGISAFAHELAHAIDFASNTAGVYLSKYTTKGGNYDRNLIDLAKKTMNGSDYQIEKAMKLGGRITDQQKENARELKARIGLYYRLDPEIFARLVEQLSSTINGRTIGSNSILSDGDGYYYNALSYWDKESFDVLRPLVERQLQDKIILARKETKTSPESFGGIYEIAEKIPDEFKSFNGQTLGAVHPESRPKNYFPSEKEIADNNLLRTARQLTPTKIEGDLSQVMEANQWIPVKKQTRIMPDEFAANILKMKDINNWERSAISMAHPWEVVKKQDGAVSGGMVRKWIAQPMLDAEKSVLSAVKNFQEEFKALQKKTHIYYGSRRSALAQKIAEGTATREEMISVDNGIREMAAWTRNRYDEFLNRINESRSAIGKDPIAKRSDYITHFNEVSTILKLLEEVSRINEEVDINNIPSSMLQISYFTKPNSPFFKFAKRRIEGIYKNDIVGAMNRYVEPAYRQIYVTKAMKQVRDLLEYRVKIPSEYEGGYEKDQQLTLDGKDGRTPKRDSVSVFGMLYPNAYAYWTDWLNHASGKRPQIDKLLPRSATSGMGVMSNLAYLGTLAGNISSVLQQLWALRNTMAEVGGLYVTKGAIANLNMAFRTFADEHSRILMGRTFEIPPSGSALLSKGSKALSYLLEKFDYETTRIGWLSGYFKGYDIGLRGTDLLNYADDMALISNSSASKLDRPPINRGQTLTFLGKFQTFVYGEWGQQKDIIRGVIKPSAPYIKNQLTDAWRRNRWDNFGRYVNFLIGTLILYWVYEEAGLPNPLRGNQVFGSKNPLLNATFASVPWISTARYGGSPPLKLLLSALDAMQATKKQQKAANKKLLSSAVRMIPAGGQTYKSITGYEVAKKGYYKRRGRAYHLDTLDKLRAVLFGPYGTKAYERANRRDDK